MFSLLCDASGELFVPGLFPNLDLSSLMGN